ncbi:MAG: HlyD family efflux transporter periplasmic adaptor subunit [Deltaproteobacteria bacterium]|nr:HlyD family efflux transporter periplasmic adaptor subunit [Deltaproteobacteria bacterium]
MVISGISNRERRTVKFILMAMLLLGLMCPAACGSIWPGQEKSANEIKLAGRIEATETDLAFQVPGRIEAISIELGEDVKAGQVVAKLDDKVFRHEVDAAEGAWEAADATPGPKKLKDAELRQAKAALELAKLRLTYATLTSPVSGLVLARSANPGELAAVGATIITLGDLDNVWFEGYLPERDLGKVRYGQKAAITIDWASGEKYSGAISYIAAKAEFTPKTVETYRERVTMVYRIRIKLPNPQRALKVGMPAEAVISLAK